MGCSQRKQKNPVEKKKTLPKLAARDSREKAQAHVLLGKAALEKWGPSAGGSLLALGEAEQAVGGG